MPADQLSAARPSGDLSAVLSEFARTMVTDFPIQGILDRLVQRIVDVLPVTAAGVTLISPDSVPRFVAASSDGALQLEQLQSALGNGPCVTAFESNEVVIVPDLPAEDRYQEFAGVARDVGMRAVFAFPMRHNDGRLGALDLFRDTPGTMADADVAAAQTLADVAAAYVLNAQRRQDSEQAADLLRHASLHDALTGLANRVLLQQRLDHAAHRARRSHADAAVLFADLDSFKQVNDTHGHAVGDALLVAVAQRLTGLLRPGDTLARVSGDEFVILCEDLRDTSDVEALAQRIGAAFREPFRVPAGNGLRGAHDDLALAITASVGLAFAGCAEDIGERLVHDADIAMYQAKRKGGAARRVIDLREAGNAADRLLLQRDLRTAFSLDKLDLAYQPIVWTADQRVTGVEALLRWRHPDRGPVPTAAMVDIAEQSNLIVELGAWVLRRSCEDRMSWLTRYPGSPMDVAVTVSTRQLMGAGFRDTVAQVLADTGMAARALTLEVTESIFLDDGPRAMVVLTDLRELGVRLALDAFGTAYSSLAYLRQFPVDMVKIDQGVVADIGVAPAGGAILAAVTNLAHVLGFSVTAEGVETARQHEEVVATGCEYAQGFHYARPMSAEDIVVRLAAGVIRLPHGWRGQPDPACRTRGW